jgi:hypothetical protein
MLFIPPIVALGLVADLSTVFPELTGLGVVFYMAPAFMDMMLSFTEMLIFAEGVVAFFPTEWPADFPELTLIFPSLLVPLPVLA